MSKNYCSIRAGVCERAVVELVVEGEEEVEVPGYERAGAQ